VSLVAGLGEEVFDAVLPEVEQEAKHAGFVIVGSLFPTEDELYLTLFTGLCDGPFPEAGLIGDVDLDSRCMSNWWVPVWINLTSFQTYQCTACLFAHLFDRT